MFKDDMVCDGIENCVQYINNFNPEKSKNPFAYFTQIIHYAFLRRIQKEKKQLEIKTKIIERSGYEEVMVVEDGAGGTSSDYNQIKDCSTNKDELSVKIAIITDQHFGARKNSKLFHDYFLKFYEDIFFPTLIKEGITTIVDMGDTF